MIDAVDLTAAVAHLKRMGLFPLEVVPLESAKGTATPSSLPKKPLPRATIALWARTIGQGIQAGLTLTQALHLLSEQEAGRPLGAVTRHLEEQVTGGSNLSEAMEQLGEPFPPVAVHLVKAGEVGGALEEVLEALSTQVEIESELIAKVRGALIYPLFVLTLGIATVAFVIWVILPKLTLLFAETGQPLPLATRLMVGSGRAFLFGLGATLLGLGVGGMGARLGWWRAPLGSWVVGVLSRLPLFGRLIAQAEVARLSATLGLLIGHGLPLPEALRLCAGTIGRPRLRDQIQQSQRLVVEGVALSAGFRRVGVREPFLLTMIAMGEAQGDLARAFTQAAGRYHQEVDRTVKVLSTLIEPMMIIGVGLIVGGIVISMLLPIFQLNFTVE